MKTRKRRTNTEFISECKKIHKGFYTYDKTIYYRMHDKVTITCPIHGDFQLEANQHIRGTGCRNCAFVRNTNLQRGSNETFIQKAMSIYGDRYDYSKIKYGQNAHCKVLITCKEHGDFITTPNRHLSQKVGCPACGMGARGWTKTSWCNACRGKIAKLYIIRCYNNEEDFFKIGITCKSLETRFGHKSQMPYKWELIELIESNNHEEIFLRERELHKKNKNNKYIPKILFGGFSECFNRYSDIH